MDHEFNIWSDAGSMWKDEAGPIWLSDAGLYVFTLTLTLLGEACELVRANGDALVYVNAPVGGCYHPGPA